MSIFRAIQCNNSFSRAMADHVDLCSATSGETATVNATAREEGIADARGRLTTAPEAHDANMR